ncbi:hypothetical protein [Methylobacterium durans]|uniref:Uncharacterized protein n=1 Tax=Methylobacterium durans TaxID=2202825 RepID=A0A2U8WA48_9HYPH|nr:hypothetical protein [Methylobacterium durans]AWN43007.1 hypothetical protein DK389_24065 [Methylobacterium durans]
MSSGEPPSEPERADARKGPDRALSHHILPSAATMIGICTTLIGLVKIAEGQVGMTRVDEFVGLSALLFLVSALTSYLSLRMPLRRPVGQRLERAADLLFLLGLIALSALSIAFAYEVI